MLDTEIVPRIVPLYEYLLDSSGSLYKENKVNISQFDLSILSCCNGNYNIGQIARTLSVSSEKVQKVIHIYEKKDVLLIMSPATRKHRKQKIILIEPHSDDICLSMGGTSLQISRAGYPISILNVFSQSCYIRKKIKKFIFENTQAKAKMSSSRYKKICTHIRKQEAGLFAHYMGASCIFLDFTDSNIQKEIYQTQCENEKESHICTAIHENITKILNATKSNFLIFCPLGIGDHPDHQMVFSALVKWLQSEGDGTYIVFYEDLPYSAFIKLPEESIVKYLRKYGLDNKPIYNDISDAIEEKTTLIRRIFRSQFPNMRNVLSNYALHLGQIKAKCSNSILNGKYYERFWLSRQAVFPVK